MRLPIVSLAIFAVCFGLFGCTNARNSNESTNFLLVVNISQILTSQYSTQDGILSNNQIKNHSKSFKSYNSVTGITSYCANKNIYILRYNFPNTMKKKTLDVIRYDENNTFEIINQVENMFDNAISIASDWTTGKVYWIEKNNYEYSIKFTDESFNETKYIFHPDVTEDFEKLQVYPKYNEIFILSYGSIWYTSNLLNNTKSKLFPPQIKYARTIRDFTIDYETNKLCWISRDFILYCVNIDTSVRPLNEKDIVQISTEPTQKPTENLVAFNNTLYWTTYGNKVYRKNGNDKAVEVAGLSVSIKLSFVSSICPSTLAQKKEAENNRESKKNDTTSLTTEIVIPKDDHKQTSTLPGEHTTAAQKKCTCDKNNTESEKHDTTSSSTKVDKPKKLSLMIIIISILLFSKLL